MFCNHGNTTSLSCAHLQEFFQKDAMRLPELDGVLYLKEGKRSWKKHYFVLRASGIYYTPKGKTKVGFHNFFVFQEDINLLFSTKPLYPTAIYLASFHAGRLSWLNWKLEILVFHDGGKQEKSREKPSGPTTNSTQIHM